MLAPTLYRLRGRLALWRFLAANYQWSLVGFGVVAASIALAFIEPRLGLLAAILLMLDLLLVLRDFSDLRRRSHDYYLIGPRDLRALADAELSDTYAGFERWKARDGVAAFSRETNRLLSDSVSPPVDPPKAAFRLPETAKVVAPTVLADAVRSGRIVFNSRKVRLATDLTPRQLESGRPIRLERTTYFASEVTNELTGQRVAARNTDSLAYDGRILVLNNGILMDLAESPVSNHIGVSTIAVTSEGSLVLPIQSRESAQSAGLGAPSGSGSVDLADAKGARHLRQLLARAMERELAEECGLHHADIRSTSVTGFARLLHRGGKPEFFGVSVLNVPFNEIALTRQERAFISDHRKLRLDRANPERLHDSVLRLRDDLAEHLSLLLRLALAFLIDEIDGRPQKLETLLLKHPDERGSAG